MATSAQRPKLLVIAGPTASGKSTLALKIAKKYRGEIVSADSLTVRKHVSIGSAKPSKKQQKEVPHHLVDVAEPCADFTAAVFKELAEQAIEDIQNRGKLPVLVGGTGLYIDSVLYDFQFLPQGDRKEREKLSRLNLAGLMKLIKEQGIDTNGIDIGNKRRLIRLLETGGARPERGQIRDSVLVVGINPPRQQARQAVTERVRRMIAAGLEAEVSKLADKYGWDCEALKGIGYREWKAYFEGTQTIAETEKKIIKSTSDLAKRQRTWLKRNPHIKWFDSGDKAYVFLTKHL